MPGWGAWQRVQLEVWFGVYVMCVSVVAYWVLCVAWRRCWQGKAGTDTRRELCGWQWVRAGWRQSCGGWGTVLSAPVLHSLIQALVLEGLQYTRHCTGHWGCHHFQQFSLYDPPDIVKLSQRDLSYLWTHYTRVVVASTNPILLHGELNI